MVCAKGSIFDVDWCKVNLRLERNLHLGTTGIIRCNTNNVVSPAHIPSKSDVFLFLKSTF